MTAIWKQFGKTCDGMKTNLMKFCIRSLLLFLLVCDSAGGEQISIGTHNCYWYFGQEDSNNKADKPHDPQEYELKAGHLIGLLPQDTPLFLGLQEIGCNEEIQAIARSAQARYKHHYEPLFVKGRDSATGQNVGAILDTSKGWGVYGRPSRVSDLEHELSKHLVVRLTNATTTLDVCVVHLRRPMGNDGVEKQVEQNRALMRWAMGHLAKNPKANVVILGDFNEAKHVGDPNQALAVIFKSQPPMFDALSTLTGKVKTHTDGKAYDRIIVSDAVEKGLTGLKLDGVEIQSHRHGKGEERRLYTDHFPVVAVFNVK